MKTTNLFIVGNENYTNNIIVGTYAINNKPVYKTYTDSNGNTHRFKTRDKIVGSFNMFFKTAEEFNAFSAVVKSNESSVNFSVPVTVTVNNTGEEKLINAFIDYETTRNLNGRREDYFDVFKVNIEER